MKKNNMKKGLLGVVMTVAMMGMFGVNQADAKGYYFFCSELGQLIDDDGHKTNVNYFTDVFYSTDLYHESEFMAQVDSEKSSDFYSDGSSVHCFHYDSEKKTIRSRRESVNESKSLGIKKIRYSSYKGM